MVCCYVMNLVSVDRVVVVVIVERLIVEMMFALQEYLPMMLTLMVVAMRWMMQPMLPFCLTAGYLTWVVELM